MERTITEDEVCDFLIKNATKEELANFITGFTHRFDDTLIREMFDEFKKNDKY